MPKNRPSCFGIPERCMPRDANGIIQPQENCNLCEYLRECLQTAITACGGIDKIRSERDSALETPTKPDGIVGAILRWSDRKRAAQKNDTS